MIPFIKSFFYAFDGIIQFFRSERNGRIQLLLGCATIVLSAWLHISAGEWLLVIGNIAAIISLEMVNSAVEKLCNLLHPGQHPAIKFIKDVAAGAVLWSAVCSVVIACIVFVPKLKLL
ncbi:diacylglycerol kinase family protein [Deminuibacter soli]|uniref:Diacylglycerol kinase family protein n=1 Tax=Deminuibacter soli TaxID=2291815 RepID=A0A3E1NRZ6_9BACT|nr:diacylglycerol kinase family protein [Deminuibacter soli]